MAPSKRFFFLVYPDERVKPFLDGIKAIADPTQKSLAHITVKGPYQNTQTKRLNWDSDLVNGQDIHVSGCGCFFHENQNTVLLKCERNPVLQTLWASQTHKTYPNFNPHITLYDGNHRTYAQNLLDIINSHQINFHFTVNKLNLYTSPATEEGFLRNKVNYNWLNQVTGFSLNKEAIVTLPQNDRLLAVDRLCRALGHLDNPANCR